MTPRYDKILSILPSPYPAWEGARQRLVHCAPQRARNFRNDALRGYTENPGLCGDVSAFFLGF
jgi:hypothetical protein